MCLLRGKLTEKLLLWSLLKSFCTASEHLTVQEKQPLLAAKIKPGAPDLVEQAESLSARLATMNGENEKDLISAQNKVYTNGIWESVHMQILAAV